MNKSIYKFTNNDFEQRFVGPLDQHINLISTELNMQVIHVNSEIIIDDKDDDKIIKALVNTCFTLFQDKINFGTRDLIQILSQLKNSNAPIEDVIEEIINFYHSKPLILNTYDGNKIYAKTLIQKKYFSLLETSTVLFVTGAAGTGKTYLAVAYAVSELKKNHAKKIIITRPAVEAGEKLGFLPGDLKEKVDPYLIPIYDALNDFLGKENVERQIEKGTIEVAPLAYMRGRTLDHAIIILDEAQNTTSNQMKMFITRLGFNSKMIITGDLTQVDLGDRVTSGLLEATSLLKGIKGIEHLHFSKYDVMRHPLVTKILERYGDE